MFDYELNENRTPVYPGTCGGIIHVVEKGDTLYRLSRYYHVSVSEIMYQNPYANIYNLQVGDELCIPVGKKS
jgi:LysM repeat protein